jgi:hypothetical protein
MQTAGKEMQRKGKENANNGKRRWEKKGRFVAFWVWQNVVFVGFREASIWVFLWFVRVWRRTREKERQSSGKRKMQRKGTGDSDNGKERCEKGWFVDSRVWQAAGSGFRWRSILGPFRGLSGFGGDQGNRKCSTEAKEMKRKINEDEISKRINSLIEYNVVKFCYFL